MSELSVGGKVAVDHAHRLWIGADCRSVSNLGVIAAGDKGHWKSCSANVTFEFGH
ncbi:MAG TPA: hypothetical protein VFA65_12715 [Bryobacteraceae bacterium]|nr:hypothetical protein [Bryobacteraceae bacterium]